MAAAKEIRTKIASVKNTQKITKAMEMVAASKMRKAQERMQSARPYAEKILNVINHVGQAHPEYRHAFLKGHGEVKRVGLIIVSTDRGLCGGLNSNLFREVLRRMKEWNDQGIEIDLVIIGIILYGFLHIIKRGITKRFCYPVILPGKCKNVQIDMSQQNIWFDI